MEILGSPNVGIVANIRRRTRALYHKAVKQCKREKESMIAASMASSLQTNNLTEFWRTVKKHSRFTSCLPSSIDDVNGEAEIANVFAEKYSELYTSAPYDALNMARLDASIDEMIVSKCATGLCDSDHVIATNDVIEGIKLLKRNKSDGNEGLSSNHIIYGSNLLYAKTSSFMYIYDTSWICLSKP